MGTCIVWEMGGGGGAAESFKTCPLLQFAQSLQM